MDSRPATNQLIRRLPRTDRTSLLARCEPVDLVLDEVLCTPDTPLRFAWFPDSGLIAREVRIVGHLAMEVAMSGNDGMLGESLSLGIKATPYQATVRGPGVAHRIAAADFTALLTDSRALSRVVDDYMYRMMAAALRAAPCARFHTVEQRFARWLLMVDDRMRTGRLRLTHEVVAGVLGVRRSAVTIAATALQTKGLIRYTRGRISVVTHSGLKAAACGCYTTAAQGRITPRDQ